MAFDAAVVGSGPNGLAAAITLAARGWSVVVLEAAPQLGGGLATRELTLPGFHHDVYSAVHPAAAASPVFARWPLADHGLRWVHPEVAMAHPLPGGRSAALHRSVEDTRTSLNALHAGDGDRWAAFADPLLARFGALRATMLAGFPPVAGPARLLAGLGVGGTLEVARLLLASSATLAGELFDGDGARAWLHGAAMHGDVPVDAAGSAIAGAYLQLLGHAVGWPSPAGGSGALARALTGYLHALGGVTRVDSRVEAIVLERGRAAGVRVGDEVVRAGRVLCDTTPGALLTLLGDGLPDGRYRAGLRRFRPGAATLKVDWALDGPIPWEAEAVRRAGTVHVGGDGAGIERYTAQLRARELPEAPFVLAGQQSLADPARAPAGRHTAWGYTHVAQGIAMPGHRVEAHAARMEAQIERYAPGFRDRVIGRHLMGPDALERGDANLRGGDVGGGSYELDQLVFRPVPKLSPYRTPVRGVYLASASTFPGGAVHGVCGHAAARAALADARLPTR